MWPPDLGHTGSWDQFRHPEAALVARRQQVGVPLTEAILDVCLEVGDPAFQEAVISQLGNDVMPPKQVVEMVIKRDPNGETEALLRARYEDLVAEQQHLGSVSKRLGKKLFKLFEGPEDYTWMMH